MRTSLTIGSRGSKLALIQSETVAELLRRAHSGLTVAIEIISTQGDRNLDQPLAEIGGKGVFTQELEAALLDGSIDLAVHSLKDLPTEQPEGLTLAAISERATPNDVLVCAKWSTLEELPDGSVVGTSSPRRKAQLLVVRPELNIVDLRGNVETRIGKVTAGEIDAAILASAGLERLGLQEAIAEVLPPDVMLPAPGQGALGIQTRADDAELIQGLETIDHARTRYEVTAERTVLSELGGGCQVPIGALARLRDDGLILNVCVCGADGVRILRTRERGDPILAAEIGRRAARNLLRNGAEELIGELE